jgi:two-component sensor histidine kinase
MVGTSDPGVGVAWVATAYAVAAVLPTFLVAYAGYHHRDSPTARAFAATMASIAVWSVAYFVRLFVADPTVQFALTVVAFTGVAFTPVALLVFALRYTDRERYVTSTTVAVLSAAPATTVLLLATTGTHGLFYRTLTVAQVGALTTVTGSHGPWFWIHTAYSYGLLAVASVLLVVFGLTRRRLYRTQAAFLVLGVGVAWASNALFIAGFTPISELDLTPVGLAAGSVFLAVAVFRARLVDVTPVAREAVVAALDDAVVVVEDGRVVDINEAAAGLLEEARPLGRQADEALPEELVEVLEPARGSADGGQQVVDFVHDGERRWYSVRPIPLSGSGPGRKTGPAETGLLGTVGSRLFAGDDGEGPTVALDPGRSPSSIRGDVDGPPATVLLLTDITAQKHHLRRLRKQNEQLEEFAAAAAHDLRNPLNVIDGYLELARESGDEAHFDRVEEATDRMNRLVEDLLALGRRGRLVESTSAVDLEAVAERAWQSVEAPNATLSVTPGDPVPADKDRLIQLLENLLGNAVEQGTAESAAGGDDDGVTVTVTRTPDGFAVADDGPGIPPEKRDQVFDYGYTTREAGSGFGLAIVETVADAHGWDVRVTESEAGGARFEVTGVTDLDERSLPASGG